MLSRSRIWGNGFMRIMIPLSEKCQLRRVTLACMPFFTGEVEAPKPQDTIIYYLIIGEVAGATADDDQSPLWLEAGVVTRARVKAGDSSYWRGAWQCLPSLNTQPGYKRTGHG